LKRGKFRAQYEKSLDCMPLKKTGKEKGEKVVSELKIKGKRRRERETNTGTRRGKRWKIKEESRPLNNTLRCSKLSGSKIRWGMDLEVVGDVQQRKTGISKER